MPNPEAVLVTPKAAFEIRPVEQSARNAAGGEYQAQRGRTRPGIFYVNTFACPRARPDAETCTCTKRSPAPFQIALQQN